MADGAHGLAAVQVLLDRDVSVGTGVLSSLPDLISRRAARRVLLITGQASWEASGASQVLPALSAVAEVSRWSDFRANPDAADLLRGMAVLDAHQPDVVVGIGGGSAMDMAKLLCAFDGLADGRALHRAIAGGAGRAARRRGLVLVPTTSGSGSEATRFAVVYVQGEKHSVAGDDLLPDAVLLDPSLACSGTTVQRASSAIDAVAQAVESRWAAGATDGSRQHADAALALLLPSIEPFATAPTSASARAMALGSHLAGRAIDVSRTTGPHALSYALTSGHGIPHGHAVALTLGAFLEVHATAGPDQLAPGVTPAGHAAAMDAVLGHLGASAATARAAVADLLRRIGLAPVLSEELLGGPVPVEGIAASVNRERLGNNPVALTAAELRQIIRRSTHPV